MVKQTMPVGSGGFAYRQLKQDPPPAYGSPVPTKPGGVEMGISGGEEATEGFAYRQMQQDPPPAYISPVPTKPDVI